MALEHTIQLYRGNFANLPTTGLSAGLPLVTLDRKTLHVAEDATTTFTVTPALELLTTLGTVSGADDYILIHDNSEATGQKEKKMTFNAFKTALNIPESSTDELVAVVDGGTSGYLWGTTGSDGVIRMGDGMSWTKDAGNAFVTIDLDLNVSATFTGDGGATALDIANLGITTAMLAAGAVTNAKLDASALSLDGTTFSGNGVTTPLDIAVVDGGTF